MKLEYTSQVLRGWPFDGSLENSELVASGSTLINGDLVEMQATGTVAKTGLTNTRRAGLVVRGNGDSASAANASGFLMIPQPAKTVTAISAWVSPGFLTVTAVGHGYTVGSFVTIAGVTTTAVNGNYNVETVVDADNFTILLATTPGAITLGSPTVTLISGVATNGKALVLWGNYIVATSNYDTTKTYVPGSPITVSNGKFNLANSAAGAPIASTSITAAANVATYTTATAHGFVAGQKVTVTGATHADYNVVGATILSTPLTTTFTYAIASTPGAASVQGSAVTLKDPEIGYVTQVQGVTAKETAHLKIVVY